jgi:hypothetical protein
MYRATILISLFLIFIVVTASAHEWTPTSAEPRKTARLTIVDELVKSVNDSESIHVQASRNTDESGKTVSSSPIVLLSGSQTIKAKRTSGAERPLRKSHFFWITEFGYSRRFKQPVKSYSEERESYGYHWTNIETYIPARQYFTWELGPMGNLNPKTAMGATLLFGVDGDDVVRFGMKPRYRRWLDKKTSIDIAPGILLRGSEPLKSALPGFTAHVGLNFEDTIIIYGQMEIHRLENYGTDVAWYSGIKLGSSPGLIAGAIYGFIKAIGSMDFGSGIGGGGSFGGCGG